MRKDFILRAVDNSEGLRFIDGGNLVVLRWRGKDTFYIDCTDLAKLGEWIKENTNARP